MLCACCNYHPAVTTVNGYRHAMFIKDLKVRANDALPLCEKCNSL